MALINCTINSASVEVTGDVADIATQELYIVPNEGFTVSKIDFSVGDISHASNGSDIWTITGTTIDTITLTDTTSPHMVGNKVKVEVNLDDTYSISSDTQLIIDIDGEARDENVITVNPVLVQGDFWYSGGDYGDYTDCDITVTADAGNGFTVAQTTHTTVNNNGESHEHWTFTGNVLSGISTKIGTVSVERATEHVVDRSVNSANIYSQGSSWDIGHSKFEALNNTLTNLDSWGDKVTFDLYFSDTSSTTDDDEIEEVATSLISMFRVMSTSLEDTEPSIDDITVTDTGTGTDGSIDPDSGDVEVTVTTSTGSTTGDTEATVTIEMFEGLGTLEELMATLNDVGSTFTPSSSITYSTTTDGSGVDAEVTVWVDSNGLVYQVSVTDVGSGYVVGDSLTIGTVVTGTETGTTAVGTNVGSMPDVFSGVSPTSGDALDATLSSIKKSPPTADTQTSNTITTKFPCPALSGKVAKGFLLVVTSDVTSIISSSAKKAAGSKLSGSALGNKVFIPVYQYANPTIGLKAIATGTIASSATAAFGFVSYTNVTTAGTGVTSSATATPFNGLPNANIESVTWMNNGLMEQDFIFKLEETSDFTLKQNDAVEGDFVLDNEHGNVVEITNLITAIDNTASPQFGTVSGTIRYNGFGTGDTEYTINFDDIFTIAR
jgi:hypothetical protein